MNAEVVLQRWLDQLRENLSLIRRACDNGGSLRVQLYMGRDGDIGEAAFTIGVPPKTPQGHEVLDKH